MATPGAAGVEYFPHRAHPRSRHPGPGTRWDASLRALKTARTPPSANRRSRSNWRRASGRGTPSTRARRRAAGRPCATVPSRTGRPRRRLPRQRTRSSSSATGSTGAGRTPLSSMEDTLPLSARPPKSLAEMAAGVGHVFVGPPSPDSRSLPRDCPARARAIRAHDAGSPDHRAGRQAPSAILKAPTPRGKQQRRGRGRRRRRRPAQRSPQAAARTRRRRRLSAPQTRPCTRTRLRKLRFRRGDTPSRGRDEMATRGGGRVPARAVDAGLPA
jgi:hypothetical protein